MKRLAALISLALLAACSPVEGLSSEDAGEVSADGAPPPAMTADGGADAAAPPATPATPATSFTVGGTADGLDGATVTLRMNGASTDVKDGAFTFPARLADDTTYDVAVVKNPATRTCTVKHAAGRVSGADVTTVEVHCLSSDAALSALATAGGTLAPAFSPTQFAYQVRRPVPMFTPDLSTAITATTTSPLATMTLDGAPLASGVPTSPFALALGETLFHVDVTAPDHATTSEYVLSVSKHVAYDYLKASNTSADSHFGTAMALADDTLVVGAPDEASGSPLDESDQTAPHAGAIYIYRRAAGSWVKEAYIKAPHPHGSARFGASVALAGDTLVVGAINDSYGAAGDDTAPAAAASGAAYVYVRSGTTWTFQAYLKPGHPVKDGAFGASVAVSGDTVAVGEEGESSAAVGIGGNETSTSVARSGAVFVYVRAGGAWTQQAYIKASNPRAFAAFGDAVALSGDTLAVASSNESSGARTIGGSEVDQSQVGAGAVYVYVRSGVTWTKQAYVKSANAVNGYHFGVSIALDGDTLAVGQPVDGGTGTGIGSNPLDVDNLESGAVFVYARSGTTWSQQAYVKPPVQPRYLRYFGGAVTLSGDMLAVGSPQERSRATLFGGSESDTGGYDTGAAYLYRRSGVTWAQAPGYLKPTNTVDGEVYGTSVALGPAMMVVGAPNDSSAATLVGGSDGDKSAPSAGAVWALYF